MPRIASRVEPYTSPTRQQRHYKCKRDIILRSLGKASYINGSQFAILWVTARGDTECYASDGFQPKLNEWFTDAFCADAMRTARLAQERNKMVADSSTNTEPSAAPDEEAAGSDALHGDGIDDDDAVHNAHFGKNADLEQGDESLEKSTLDSALAPIDSNAAESYNRLPNDVRDQSSASPPSCPTLSTSAGKRARRYLIETPGEIFDTEAKVIKYLSAKINELQQATCKIVVRSWIKNIEPKKQSSYPYAGGDGTKPKWWPQHVRHKEPDHLTKNERIDVLVGILLSPYCSTHRLEYTTGEYSAFLNPEKRAVLRDMFNVARAYENMRKVQGDDPFAPFSVSATLSAARTGDELPLSPPKNARKRPRLSHRAVSDQGPPSVAAAAYNAEFGSSANPLPIAIVPEMPQTHHITTDGPLGAPAMFHHATWGPDSLPPDAPQPVGTFFAASNTLLGAPWRPSSAGANESDTHFSTTHLQSSHGFVESPHHPFFHEVPPQQYFPHPASGMRAECQSPTLTVPNFVLPPPSAMIQGHPPIEYDS